MSETMAEKFYRLIPGDPEQRKRFVDAFNGDIPEIVAELAALRAKAALVDRLLAALKEIIGMLDDGSLVRPIDQDAKPGWAFQVMPTLMKIARAQELIAEAEAAAKPTDQQYQDSSDGLRNLAGDGAGNVGAANPGGQPDAAKLPAPAKKPTEGGANG